MFQLTTKAEAEAIAKKLLPYKLNVVQIYVPTGWAGHTTQPKDDRGTPDPSDDRLEHWFRFDNGADLNAGQIGFLMSFSGMWPIMVATEVAQQANSIKFPWEPQD